MRYFRAFSGVNQLDVIWRGVGEIDNGIVFKAQIPQVTAHEGVAGGRRLGIAFGGSSMEAHFSA
jgi:hypothetical protein